MNDWMIAFVCVAWPMLFMWAANIDKRDGHEFHPFIYMFASAFVTLLWLTLCYGVVLAITIGMGWFS